MPASSFLLAPLQSQRTGLMDDNTVFFHAGLKSVSMQPAFTVSSEFPTIARLTIELE